MKISTGIINFKNNVKKKTDELEGEIVKIRVHNRKTNPNDLWMTVTTIDGETLVNREISGREMIFYPRNSYAVNEVLYLDIEDLKTVKPNGSAEKYYVEGPLIIEFTSRNKPAKDITIDNIVITVR